MPAVNPRDLVHYPFLPEAQKFLVSRGISVDTLAESSSGRQYLDKAATRVMYAIDGKNLYPEDTSGDNVSDLVTYVLARILISCVKDRTVQYRFVRAESRRIVSYLAKEPNKELRDRVNLELGVSGDTGEIPVLDYIAVSPVLAASRDHGVKWRLVNRNIVRNGYVEVSEDECEIMLAERVRAVLERNLPVPVSDTLSSAFQPWTEKLNAKAQEVTLARYGPVESSAFPPCIQALMEAAKCGSNIVHAGRFSLVAFLYTIGMPEEQIESIFSSAPGYNPELTMYQVNHILQHEYRMPRCSNMMTGGICVNRDALCEKILSPMRYYRQKKNQMEYRKAQYERNKAYRAAEKAKIMAQQPEQNVKKS